MQQAIVAAQNLEGLSELSIFTSKRKSEEERPTILSTVLARDQSKEHNRKFSIFIKVKKKNYGAYIRTFQG